MIVVSICVSLLRYTSMKPLHCLLLALPAFALSGCGPESNLRADKLLSENASLSKELADTKRELEELKNGPANLLAQAEQSALKADWIRAKKQTAAILSKYPASTEAFRAKQLLASSEAGLARAAKEAEVAEARRVAEERQQRAQEERRLVSMSTDLGGLTPAIGQVP